MNLINIEQTAIGGNLIETVNARELHEFLESRQDFSTWIKNRIEQYGFEEGVDFTLHKFVERRATRIDYYISIDMAKELSMVERNDKGKQARQYFIECERKAKSQTQPTNQIENAASHLRALKSVALTFNLDENAALVSANVATRELTGIDFQKLLKIELKSPEQVVYVSPTEIGKNLTPPLSPQKVNNLLRDRGFQTKVGKTWVPTELGSKFSRAIDTGKQHSNGTMIQQVKWNPNVINECKIKGAAISLNFLNLRKLKIT